MSTASAKRRKTSLSSSAGSEQESVQTSCRKVVPWSSAGEWLEIQRKVLDGSKESRKSALSRLRVWELRFDSKKCPPYIEATIHLLRAFLADEENADTSEVLSVYGEAINKFVQTILERAAKSGEAFQNKAIAENLGIPQWIIDVRNDAIHHFRGSLPLYRTTAETAFDWLKQTYWRQSDRGSEKPLADMVIDDSFHEYIQIAVSAKSSAERSTAEYALASLKEFVATTNLEWFVEQLVELEALTSIDEAYSLNEIPLNYRNAYLPIFAMLGDELTTLFVETIKTLALPAVICLDRDVDRPMRLIYLWITWLVSGNAVTDGDNLGPKLNFKKILQAAATVVSTSTMALLEVCFTQMRPPLSEHKADFVRKLYVAFSGERAIACDGTNGADNITISTVEDVVAERANRNKLHKDPLPSTSRLDWSVVPLGLLPDNVAVGDLYLDVDIDGDYVPFDVETEDDAVIRHERKFLEEQKQNQEIRKCNVKAFDDIRDMFSDAQFQFWRIQNTQGNLPEPLYPVPRCLQNDDEG